MTERWSNFAPVSSNLTYLQGAATCDQCNRLSVGSRPLTGDESRTEADKKFNGSTELRWHPLKIVVPDFPDVPEHIARAAKEAHEADSINARMAAILMARTVVEATAKDRGITKGSLVAKIDDLATQGFIRESTKDAAHEIRHFGNDMAHGDISDLPDADDVADVLALMDEVLNEVFQGPARTARVKARRTQPATAQPV